MTVTPARLLGLAAVVLLAFESVTGFFAAARLGFPATSVAALVIFVLGSVFALLPLRGRAKRHLPVPVVAVCWVVPVLNTWAQPGSLWPDGVDGWLTMGVICLALVLVARGHVVAGWVAAGGMLLVAVPWALTTGRSVPGTVIAIVWALVWLAVGTGFAVLIDRLERRTATVAERVRTRAGEAARASAVAEERGRRYEQLRTTMGPLLDRLVGGWRPGPAEVPDLLMREATLRDELRGRWLYCPQVQDAALAARRRGVEVVLTAEGEFTDVPDAFRTRALDRIGETLRAARSGRVVVRAQDTAGPTSTSLARISIVTVPGPAAPELVELVCPPPDAPGGAVAPGAVAPGTVTPRSTTPDGAGPASARPGRPARGPAGSRPPRA